MPEHPSIPNGAQPIVRGFCPFWPKSAAKPWTNPGSSLFLDVQGFSGPGFAGPGFANKNRAVLADLLGLVERSGLELFVPKLDKIRNLAAGLLSLFPDYIMERYHGTDGI